MPTKKSKKIEIEIFEGEAQWCAAGVKESIFTQGNTLDELMENIREAVSLHFEDDIAKGIKIEIQLQGELALVSQAPASQRR